VPRLNSNIRQAAKTDAQLVKGLRRETGVLVESLWDAGSSEVTFECEFLKEGLDVQPLQDRGVWREEQSINIL